MHRLELVCPAGNEEALHAAVEYGADSVYLGGSAFGARASAVNFDDDGLANAVKYAHFAGARILVTVNTLILENELPQAIRQVDAIHTAGADGLIVQDLGLAAMIRNRYPNAPLHGSTQMAIHNTEGAQKLLEMGYKRVVLARECSLEDIEEITRHTDIEIEAFCHGALCVCVSGECLMSSMIGGRSGNRGRCAQPCRLPYTLLGDGKKPVSGSLLSPRDLCMLPVLEKMAEAGVKAFKIEGRLKRPGYVATMTKTYREALDRIEHAGSYTPSAADLKHLASVFSRGGKFSTGYMLPGLDHTALMSHQTPAYVETPEADVMPEPYIREKEPVTAEVRLVAGEKPSVTFSWNGHTATAEGEAPLEKAQRTPATCESAARSLEKLGDTPFVLAGVSGTCENAFVPASLLNALRRDAAGQLSAACLDGRMPQWHFDEPMEIAYPKERPETVRRAGLMVWASDRKQAEAALENGADGLYWAPAEWQKPLKDAEAFAQYRAEGKKILLAVPLLLRTRDLALVKERVLEVRDRIDGVFAPNIGIAVWAKSEGLRVVGDIGLNITNPVSRDICFGIGFERVTLSPEMTASQVRDCGGARASDCEAVVYGRLPLMTLAHCPIRACSNVGTGDCFACRNRPFVLKDRVGAEFPLHRTHLSVCQQTLYNSVPMHTAGQWKRLPSLGGWQLRFTDETPEECAAITAVYRALLDGEEVPVGTEKETTSGHWFRGVQ